MAHLVTNVAEYAIILNDKKEFLLVQWGAHYDYSWHFPGGRMDDGDADGEGLLRELREEIGVEATGLRVVHTRYISNDEIHRIEPAARDRYAVFYLAELKPGFIPKISPEEKDLVSCKWFSRSDLPHITFWLPFYREMLEKVLPE